MTSYKLKLVHYLSEFYLDMGFQISNLKNKQFVC